MFLSHGYAKISRIYDRDDNKRLLGFCAILRFVSKYTDPKNNLSQWWNKARDLVDITPFWELANLLETALGYRYLVDVRKQP